jgi:predicted transcriptional regulator
MNKDMTNSIKSIFKDTDLSQKEIALILDVTQSNVSKKIVAANFTLVELFKLSKAKEYDYFSAFSNLLPSSLRNSIKPKEYKSEVETAILNLVRQTKK